MAPTLHIELLLRGKNRKYLLPGGTLRPPETTSWLAVRVSDFQPLMLTSLSGVEARTRPKVVRARSLTQRICDSTGRTSTIL